MTNIIMFYRLVFFIENQKNSLLLYLIIVIKKNLFILINEWILSLILKIYKLK